MKSARTTILLCVATVGSLVVTSVGLLSVGRRLNWLASPAEGSLALVTIRDGNWTIAFVYWSKQNWNQRAACELQEFSDKWTSLGVDYDANAGLPSFMYKGISAWSAWRIHFNVGIQIPFGSTGRAGLVIFPTWALVCIALIPPMLLIIVRYTRHRRRLVNNECVECGYSLRQNRSGVCPECGALSSSVMSPFKKGAGKRTVKGR